MKTSEYQLLYQKMLRGECTPEEKELLLKYEDELNIQDFDNSEKIEDQDRIKDEIYSKLINEIKSGRTNYRKLWVGLTAAASLLLICGLGLHFYLQPDKETAQQMANQPATKNIISAGGDKAVLTLADGKEVNLEGANKGVIYSSGGIQVTKSENGQIVYEVSENKSQSQSIQWNSIKTPTGGEFQVVLPDGTHVWLNAASTLKFPTSFKGKERSVEVDGEAYFEVAKNKLMPFVVNAHGLKVNVLGTHFNVLAYDDEEEVQTTLVEGSVRLNYGSNSKMLVPGEQGSIRKGEDIISKQQVNTEEVVSWKNGYFMFRQENIKTIMTKVARWYGVEIEYQGDMDHVVLGGTVSRDKDISELLGKLELTGAVHFKIEGRTVRVISN